jgi:4-amino-4-deoxy-L-arabinose transferase-like glycosyltransferase
MLAGDGVALIGILAVAATLRLFRMDLESLWMDEYFAALIAQQESAGRMIAMLLEDMVHPPLFYTVIFSLSKWIGFHEHLLRLLSVAFNLGSIAVAFFFTKRWWGRSAAVLVALMIAVSAFQVHYAREIRMYAWLTFFSLASFYLFCRLLEERSRLRIYWWALMNTLFLPLHYYATLIVLAQFVVLVLSRERSMRALRGPVLAHAPIATFLLLWGYWSNTGRPNVDLRLGWLARPGLIEYYFLDLHEPTRLYKDSLYHSVSQFVLGWQLSWGDEFFRSPRLEALVVCFVLVLMGRYLLKGGRGELERACVWWLFLPIIIAFITSWIATPIFLSRYLIVVTFPFYLLLALSILDLDSPRMRTACVSVLLGIMASSTIGFHAKPLKPRWALLARTVNDSFPQTLPIYVDWFPYADYLEYYLPDSRTIRRVATEREEPELNRGRPEPAVFSASQIHDRAFVNVAFKPRAEMLDHFARSGYRIEPLPDRFFGPRVFLLETPRR